MMFLHFFYIIHEKKTSRKLLPNFFADAIVDKNLK